VKLDIGLVRQIDHDDVRQALVAGIVYFAKKSGCRLIAEGIETAGERDQLRALGVDLGQGYLLGRPASAGELPDATDDGGASDPRTRDRARLSIPTLR
jgi:EAL domain-containing protein (putative c-di-GMP-specific phosphodiesterase class I)